jgi:hypothetical protein
MTSHESTGTALPERAVRELVAAAATLVTDHDVIGTLTAVLAGCAECVDAAAAGVLLSSPDGSLEFLAATNHRAAHLELYQSQLDEGPAADCVTSGQPITGGPVDLAGRWPKLADAFRTAGFRGVHAAPMIWQGQTMGAVNLFFAGEPAADVTPVAQAFADIACVVILQTGPAVPGSVQASTQAALDDRTVIERAKGVLAYTHDLSVDDAFDRLVSLAHDQHRPLTAVAADIVDQAVNGGT